MSPEQAKGQPVDQRSDVFSFGAILFEMLAGQRAFDGDTPSEAIAAVLRGEPDWTRLAAPPALVRVLRRCLAKDRKARFAAMADVRHELEELSAPAAAVDSGVHRASRNQRCGASWWPSRWRRLR